jgi:hypothetical protein
MLPKFNVTIKRKIKQSPTGGKIKYITKIILDNQCREISRAVPRGSTMTPSGIYSQSDYIAYLLPCDKNLKLRKDDIIEWEDLLYTKIGRILDILPYSFITDGKIAEVLIVEA